MRSGIRRRCWGRVVRVVRLFCLSALFAVLVTSLVGTIDEGIQAVLPNRVFDSLDILFNVLAAGMATAASAALGWARRVAMRTTRGGSGSRSTLDSDSA